MIVRDEESNLPHCLESVRGVFDEIIVVDTGSKDRTIEIARSFGAKVFEFAWIDSFSAARNEALSHATGDYAFWLDADDVVEPREVEKLRALLGTLRRVAVPTEPSRRDDSFGVRELAPASSADESGSKLPHSKISPGVSRCSGSPGDIAAAYVVRCACDPSPDGTGGETVVDHIRLFPLRDDVRWTYRVHEQILPALRKANVSVRWTDLTVRHTGYVDRALRDRKLERDTRILIRELEERPDDPVILFNLGAIAVERHEWHEALRFLERSLAGSAPTDSIVRKIFALIARSHQMLEDTQAALRTCARGLELDPADAELWFRKAVVHRHRGESSEAEQSWRRILGLRRPDQFCSVDQGIFGHLTRRNLAALAAERGDHDEALTLWHEVLADCPGDREALAKLAQLGSRLIVCDNPRPIPSTNGR
jgi:glycosyltransferase involved in cell wall biosynthesis